MDQQHSKVDRFLKLGYSHQDIVRVLENLRQDAQTNDILEELIKTGRTGSPKTSPKLVPRGCEPSRTGPDREPGFRPVVIDGSNVAISHGNRKVFSCRGLQLAVDWFWEKGLRDITVFVPLWRKESPRPEAPITDQHILHELERRKILVYTPSRCVNGKRVVCYDDRYIVRLAVDSDGIIVSNDNYRDLQTENPQWKKFIEERLLMYTFANDKFMPPDDPLGRNGPNINDFLRNKPWSQESRQQYCPYGKKCTYGVKCKFYHPERTNQSQLSVADELRARTQPQLRSASEPAALHRCPDEDEAFRSMESSLSSLSVSSYGARSHSSGVASFCPSEVSLSRSAHVPYPHGAAPSWDHQLYYPCSSCPALPVCEPAGAPQRPHSLPRGVDPAQRKALQSQLSALFNSSMVERVMDAHPHVTNMSELVSLIQRYRNNHVSFK